MSLGEDRLHFGELPEEYDEDEDQEGEWAVEDKNFETPDFFQILCLEYRSASAATVSEGEDPYEHPPFTRPLSLKRLDMGIGCIVSKHIHILTDTRVLEELAISNRDLKIRGDCNPYKMAYLTVPFMPALAPIKGIAPNLPRVSFENFEYGIDAKGIDMWRDFPQLSGLVVGEVEETLEEDLKRLWCRRREC